MSSLHALFTPRNTSPGGEWTGRMTGVVPARVRAVFDKSGEKRHLRGMVQVWFPGLQDRGDPNLIAPWARLCMTAAGRGYQDHQHPNAFESATKREGCGMYTPPSVGDEVLVAFEHGDMHRPYVVGQLWNGIAKTPKVTDITDKFSTDDTVAYKGHDDPGGGKHAPLQYPDLKDKEKVGEPDGDNANRLWFWRSRSGHVFLFDDSQEHPKIIVTTASGKQRIVLDQAKGKVQIVSAGYKCTKGKHPHDGPCQSDPVYEAGKAKGDQDSGSGDDWDGGDIEILATNRLWIKARKIHMVSSHNTHFVAGNHWKLKADGMVTMDSRYNTQFGVGRALTMQIGKLPVGKAPFSDGCSPPGKPGSKGDSGDVGQWLVNTKGKIDIKSLGVESQDISIKALPGKFKLTALSGIETMTPATVQHTAGGSWTETIGGPLTIVAATSTVTTSGPSTQTAGGGVTVMSGGPWMVISAAAAIKISASAMLEMSASAKISMSVSATIDMTAGMKIGIFAGTYIDMLAGAKITMIGGILMDIMAGAKMTMAAGVMINMVAGLIMDLGAGAKIELDTFNTRASPCCPSGAHVCCM